MLPAVLLAAGVAGGFSLPLVDRALNLENTSVVGQPDAAREFLAAIATLTMSVVGVAFSVTLVALQLASQQLSPRVLRTFRSDRLNQATLGAFLSASVYALLVLRSVDDQPQFVPTVSVGIALAYTLVCMGLFVAFVQHIMRSMQPDEIISRIADDGRRLLDQLPALHDDDDDRDHEPPSITAPVTVVRAERAGAVAAVNRAAIVRTLQRASARGRTAVSIGDQVVRGEPLVEISGPADKDVRDAVRAAITIGRERTSHADVRFPIRQLADVAIKALSPGLNDPTTAALAMDRTADLLVLATTRRLGPSFGVDEQGATRLELSGPSLDDLVELGFQQVRGYVAGDIDVALQLVDRLKIVAGAAAEHGVGTGEPARQAALLVEAFEREATAEADARRVRAAAGALLDA